MSTQFYRRQISVTKEVKKKLTKTANSIKTTYGGGFDNEVNKQLYGCYQKMINELAFEIEDLEAMYRYEKRVALRRISK